MVYSIKGEPWTQNLLSSRGPDLHRVILPFVTIFIMHEKLPQSDHCPCLIKIPLPSYPPLDIVNECSLGFRRHGHYDLSKQIKTITNIKQLENYLAKSGDDI